MVVVSLQEVFPICWILILTFSHIYFVIHGSGRAGSGRVCAWGRANMFRALRRTCFMLSSLLIETRSDSSRRGTGFCMNHENCSQIFSRIIQPFWRLQEYCSWFMLIFVSNLLYTYIYSNTITCHVGVSRTMLCWPLSLEMRKFTHARPDSPEERTSLIINIPKHTRTHAHTNTNLNLSHGYSTAANTHGKLIIMLHTYTHTH